MAIPGPGTAISITTIVNEFGGTVPHSISEYYRGGGLVPNTPGNAAIPTSGQIAIGDFYGSANRASYTITISADTQNYDAYTNRGPLYVPGSSDITYAINPGVTVGSASIPAYAFSVPNAFNPGDTVTIVNNGSVRGAGGTGGNGGEANALSPGFNPGGGATAGGAGGNSVYVNRPTTITNNGTIASGGGGGGGGGNAYVFGGGGKQPVVVYGGPGGGGGGGAGSIVGGGGSAGAANTPGISPAGTSGSSGTATTGGAGGSFGQNQNTNPQTRGGNGGAGGASGSAGSSGTPGSNDPSNAYPQSGASGGATGNYITGNSLVTWPATGTRQGGVA
jgi:hypothetical protein